MRLSDEMRDRLDEAADLWLATVTPDGAPHLVPMWAVRVEDAIYMATDATSRKVANLRHEDRCRLALPDTRSVLILTGRCDISETPPSDEILTGFERKYRWRPRVGPSLLLLRFVPERATSWGPE